MEHEKKEISKNITLGETGAYHWIYEFSLWKNPAVFITSFKVCLIGIMAPALLMFFLTIGDSVKEAVKVFLMIIGYGIPLMTVLLFLGYLLISIIYKGKYYVLFKMDEKGINHIQLDKQFKKAQALEFFSILLGAATNNFTLMGTNLLAATRKNQYTEFKKVKSIKVSKAFNTIYINEALKKNQIYVHREDFEFVKNFIIENCRKNDKITVK